MASISAFTVLLLLAIGKSVTSQSLCLVAPLPSDLTEWPSSGTDGSSQPIQVIWNIDRVCSTTATCYKIDNAPFNFTSLNQLPPVQVRPDQFVTFSTVNTSQSPAASAVALEYFLVNEAGFENCYTDGSQPLNITDGSPLGVSNGQLQIGTNYFIANGVNDAGAYWKCFPYGLKLNLTVQWQNCGQDSANPSSGQLCSGNGRCAVRIYEPYYSCHCCPGFIGDYCQNTDGCYQVKCQNGGTCTDNPDTGILPPYTCTCLPGYNGSNCEDQMGVLCPTNECMNGGNCRIASDTSLGFRCYCPDGYTGKVCETNINECQSNPCINGYCNDLVNAYNCTCLPDYSGTNCDSYIGLCPVGRCQNGATCQPIPEITNSTCVCLPGFTGFSCETRVPLCYTNVCINYIDCVDNGETFKCICNPGYAGVHCEANINECASNPCQHSGTCHDLIAAFSCDCPVGYKQPTCDMSNDSIALSTSGDKKANAMVGLTIAAAVLGSLFGLALIVLLVYCCAIHKPYKQLRLRRKYVHVVDETYGPSSDTADDATGAHPAPDFIAQPSPADDGGISTGSAKSPLVRRLRPSKASRI